MNHDFKYDFTTILDRRGKDALALDALGISDGLSPGAPKSGFDAIPMWVADMNFPVVPTIQTAITERVKHPAFGYFFPRREYYDLIIQWHRTHHGITDLSAHHIGYENGVIGGLVSAMNVF